MESELQYPDELSRGGNRGGGSTVATDAVQLQPGGYDAENNIPDLDVSPTGIETGFAYYVTTEGAFFTLELQPGDFLIANNDNPMSLAEWTVIPTKKENATETVSGVVLLAADGQVSSERVPKADDNRLSDERVPLDGSATNVKLFDMVANTIKCNPTAATAIPQDFFMPPETMLVRLASGNIVAGTPVEVRDLLNIEDGANDYVHPDHTGDVVSDGDGSTTIQSDTVGNVELENMEPYTVKGKSGTTAGDPEDIVIGVSEVLARLGSGLTSTKVVTALLENNSVTNAKADDMPGNTVKVRNDAATGNPVDLSMGLNTVLARIAGNIVPLSLGTNTVLGRRGADIVADQIIGDQIEDDAVINSKLGNMAANTVKVRTNAAAGDPQDLIMPDDTILGKLAGSNIAPLTVAQLKTLLGFSRIVTLEYIVGTTVSPSTSALTPGTAPLIPQMEYNITPANATNKVIFIYSGTMASDANKNDRGARVGIFVDGTFQANTERASYVFSDPEYHGNITTFWMGQPGAVATNIQARFWGEGGDDTIAQGTQRAILVLEVEQ